MSEIFEIFESANFDPEKECKDALDAYYESIEE